jgi:hypothetical protein
MNVLGTGVAVVVFSQQPSLPSFCFVLNTQKWQSLVHAAWQLAASFAVVANVSTAPAAFTSTSFVAAAAAYATVESELAVLMAMLL